MVENIEKQIKYLEKNYSNKHFRKLSKTIETLPNSIEKMEYRMRLKALKLGQIKIKNNIKLLRYILENNFTVLANK